MWIRGFATFLATLELRGQRDLFVWGKFAKRDSICTAMVNRPGDPQLPLGSPSGGRGGGPTLSPKDEARPQTLGTSGRGAQNRGLASGAATPRVATRRPEGSKQGARQKPRTMSPVLRFINAMMTLFVVAGLAVGGSVAYIMSGIDADGPLDEAKLIAVPRNDGTLSIAERLEREGVISNRHSFLISYYLLSRHAAWNNAKPMQLKAGLLNARRPTNRTCAAANAPSRASRRRAA